MGSEITGAAFAFSHDGKEEVVSILVGGTLTAEALLKQISALTESRAEISMFDVKQDMEKLPGVQTGECL